MKRWIWFALFAVSLGFGWFVFSKRRPSPASEKGSQSPVESRSEVGVDDSLPTSSSPLEAGALPKAAETPAIVNPIPPLNQVDPLNPDPYYNTPPPPPPAPEYEPPQAGQWPQPEPYEAVPPPPDSDVGPGEEEYAPPPPPPPPDEDDF